MTAVSKTKRVTKGPKRVLKKVRTAYGISEYSLSNGLRVLYRHDSTLPIAAVCVTYHVGSRNEAAGHTGATHILEHLLFKDSEHFNMANGKAITGHLEWMGASVNATTWVDRTNYFELLPAEKVAEAIALEADRMRGSRFNDADLASEMTVVRNEFERSRNNPYEILEEEVMATAFTTHPYRIPTIGIKEDIENSTAAKLREFYDRFYWPNNATLIVIGDIAFAELEKLVLKHFGRIPRSPHEIEPMAVVEPAQEEPRMCSVTKSAGVSIAALAYKTPEARSEDFVPLFVAATILAGGFSSRLQKRIVDRGLAAEIHTMMPAFFDPGLLTFTATVGPAMTAERIRDRMRIEVGAVRRAGVTPAELVRARSRLLSQIADERDGIYNEMRSLSESVAAGDWTLGYRFEEQLKKLTVADVNRAIRTYLLQAGETSGILIDSAV